MKTRGPWLLSVLSIAAAACAFEDGEDVSAEAVGATRAGATKRFHYTDHLGSVIATTRADDTILCRADYMPFGGDRASTCTGRKYNGNVQDATGLYDYGARTYDPRIARFTSADRVLGSPDNVQSHNRYAYVTNNPYRYVDPTGRAGWDVIVAGLPDLASGAANAYLSNAVPGVDRALGHSTAFEIGQDVGDAASVLIGTLEAVAGVGVAVGGGGGITVASGGIAAVAGAGVAVAGAGVAAHGAYTAGNGARSVLDRVRDSFSRNGQTRGGRGRFGSGQDDLDQLEGVTGYDSSRKGVRQGSRGGDGERGTGYQINTDKSIRRVDNRNRNIRSLDDASTEYEEP